MHHHFKDLHVEEEEDDKLLSDTTIVNVYGTDILNRLSTESEIERAVKTLKTGKAVGNGHTDTQQIY